MKGAIGGKTGGEARGSEGRGEGGEVCSKSGGEAGGGEGSRSGVGTPISRWQIVDASVVTGAVTEDLDQSSRG
jgi:hypothetical protein